MLVISLDESGNFEKPGQKPPFIGGLLFEGDVTEVKEERERILAFFQKVCEAENAVYPQDLHYNESATNKGICQAVKAEYMLCLGEFLQKGTYKGEILESERKGKYRLLIDVYRHDNCPGGNGLLADTVNSNRYEQMVADYIRYFVFLNPTFSAQAPCFELPTRITAQNSMEHVDNSSIVKKDDTNKAKRNDMVEVTNKSTYRTLIRTLINDYRLDETDFHVSSIFYGGDRNQQRNQAFLYLCDAICSLYSQNIVSNDTSAEEIYQKMANVQPDTTPMVLFYGDKEGVLECYRRAYEEALRGNIIQSLRERGKILSNKSEEGVFFTKHWCCYIDIQLDQQLSSYNQKQLCRLMTELEDCTKQTSDVYLYYSAFEFLENRVSMLIRKNGWDSESTLVAEVLYRLYDSGVAFFNHEGKTKESHDYICKMSRLAEYVDDERLKSDCVNRHTVNLIDRMMFNEAFLLSKTIAAKTGKESDKGQRGHVPTVSRARALSQFAQVCAFINEYNTSLSVEDVCRYRKLADTFFVNSLNQWMSLKDGDNYYITLCYYMHYLVSMAEEIEEDTGETIKVLKRRYQELAADYYYGETTPRRQIEAIIQRMNDTDSRNFAHSVFIWIKGSLMFYPIEQVKAALREDTIQTILSNATDKHPWELIYYYLVEAYYLSGKKEKANEVLEKYLLPGIHKETQPLLQSILCNLILRYHMLNGNTNEAEKWKDKLYESIQRVTDKRLPKEKSNCDKIITYAYT